jgi:hypothetical protein
VLKVFATPTFSALVMSLSRHARNAVIALLAVLLLGLSPVAHAEEDEAGFFSYLPAAPRLNLPKLDIVPFWTDDLKKGKKAYSSGNYDRAIKWKYSCRLVSRPHLPQGQGCTTR